MAFFISEFSLHELGLRSSELHDADECRKIKVVGSFRLSEFLSQSPLNRRLVTFEDAGDFQTAFALKQSTGVLA